MYACKYSSAHSYILGAVQSARSWMPEEPVFVIDSDSADTSYYEPMRALGATVALAHNRHYETGAWWHAYQHSDASYFYFLHDSTELRQSLATWKAQPVTVFGTIPHWEGCGGEHVARIASVCSESGYSVPNPFTGVFGSMFGCQRSVMDTLAQRRSVQFMPKSKFESECMERIWGIALTNVGVDVKASAWGPYESLCTDGAPLRKFMARRA